ncbi:MAG: propanediol utilization protein [delta proteobacterium ML8_F1]|nr:MAG: propanediol utilization protein [delta proteobacterium ML8_F1]
MDKRVVPVGLSNRHVHLSSEHIEVLFGKGHTLEVMKDLSQPNQYAAEERVELVGPKGSLMARILGPARKFTQVEISNSDSFVLGVKAPVRDSGDLEGSPGLILKGPAGEVTIEKGVIVAARHIHMHTDDARKFDLKDKSRVDVKVSGQRGLIFSNVLVRVNEEYALDFHIDLDEANAAGLKNGDLVQVL